MPQTVLYVHGLESGPGGRKARTLAQAGFTVVSRLMPCGRSQIARDPLVLAAAGAALGALAASARLGGWPGLGLGLAALGASAPLGARHLTRRILRRSLAVQTAALAAQPVDVVLGSSFGGAVALELLQRGAWAGPVVLLCPAHQLVARRAGLPAPPTLAALPAEVARRVVVVHGRADQTVPVASSQALVAGSCAQLILVDDDHRLSASATAENLTRWVALAVAGADPSRFSK